MKQSNSGIICPHCDYLDEYWWEYVDPTTEEADFEMHCQECGKLMDVEFYTTPTFITKSEEGK